MSHPDFVCVDSGLPKIRVARVPPSRFVLDGPPATATHEDIDVNSYELSVTVRRDHAVKVIVRAAIDRVELRVFFAPRIAFSDTYIGPIAAHFASAYERDDFTWRGARRMKIYELADAGFLDDRDLRTHRLIEGGNSDRSVEYFLRACGALRRLFDGAP